MTQDDAEMKRIDHSGDACQDAGGGPFLGGQSLKRERVAVFGRIAKFAGRRLARLPSMA